MELHAGYIGYSLAHEAVEIDTPDWVHRFNHRRLLGPIGNIPPAEAEAA